MSWSQLLERLPYNYFIIDTIPMTSQEQAWTYNQIIHKQLQVHIWMNAIPNVNWGEYYYVFFTIIVMFIFIKGRVNSTTKKLQVDCPSKESDTNQRYRACRLFPLFQNWNPEDYKSISC